MKRLRPIVAGLILLASASVPLRAEPVPSTAPGPATHRPRIGLVLSGGGARGISHVGVLKVLEREHIPVDLITGTSMGAIIGGLYASGMSADQIETELRKVNWDNVFASRVERTELSQRRKEQDFEVSPLIEMGLRNGEFHAPLGTVSSRGLESLLRHYTLPVRHVSDFDHLPIPFRAVATDMETGAPVVLKDGDLALALRSSMSVPGVFAPTEVNGRVLGDGGLVDNLPIDVARAMGAEVLIVVNIGTPIGGRDTLNSLVGVTTQMIAILTEQNVQRSLATLKPGDVLIAPKLEGLTSADFARASELIGQGELQTEAFVFRLGPLALSPADYARWREARRAPDTPAPQLAFVRFDGTQASHPEQQMELLESRPAQVFDEARAVRDTRRLAASGDYMRADYQLVRNAAGEEGLAFDLEEKPWGPNYLYMGLDLATDTRGNNKFNIKLAHNRHWLDDNGSEWRNVVRLGTQPRWYTELYRPSDHTYPFGLRPFASAYGSMSGQQIKVYSDTDSRTTGEISRYDLNAGLDVGTGWRELGELRLGVYQDHLRDDPELYSAEFSGPTRTQRVNETGLRLRAVFDQLDYAFFPQHGWRLTMEGQHGYLGDSSSQTINDKAIFSRLYADGNAVYTWGAHTIDLAARVGASSQHTAPGLGHFSLGGFQQLSGYSPNQLNGNNLLFGRLGYYARLATPAYARGLFAGGSIEAGNTWSARRDISPLHLRHSFSAYLGADTALGPIYLATSHAPSIGSSITFFIGRP
ncbi:patatin-like phospholipase family protein [Aquabacterium sp.]|uniref:patatin-like phospholipase family protein n=1 Tax=Aquabacterium sp. TaxID=1872578 RepID=UPI0035B0E245